MSNLIYDIDKELVKYYQLIYQDILQNHSPQNHYETFSVLLMCKSALQKDRDRHNLHKLIVYDHTQHNR